MLGQYRSRLLQIFLVVEHAIGQRLGIFRDSLGVEFSNFVGK